MSWTPDGRTLVFWEEGEAQQDRLAFNPSGDIWTVSPEGDRVPYLVTNSDLDVADLSPDGRWMAYSSDESGQVEVYIQRYPDLGDKVTISSGGGMQPQWSPEGGELFYRNLAGDRMMVAAVSTEPTLRVSRSEVLFEGRYVSSPVGGVDYDHPFFGFLG